MPQDADKHLCPQNLCNLRLGAASSACGHMVGSGRKMRGMDIEGSDKASLWISLCLGLIVLTLYWHYSSADTAIVGDALIKKVTLVDFENGIPCSNQSEIVGFRKVDCDRGRIAKEGAAGTANSAIFQFDPSNIDIFLQGNVRRKYLFTRTEQYVSSGPNLLSFWVKLPVDSALIGREELIKAGDKIIGLKRNDGATMTLMTYHWRYGDMGVGGASNQGLMTDSNMHGYSEFRFTNKAAGNWVKVALSPSAFRSSRNYFHFYGANAITDNLEFFSSIRQLQFRITAKMEKSTEVQLDEIRMETVPPAAVFDKGFHAAKVSAVEGDYSVPVTIRNPTDRERRYRVMVSSFLGAERQLLNEIAAKFDDISPMRNIQVEVGGDGGIGVAELIGSDGTQTSKAYKEITIAAGGIWQGKVVHHIKREMLGSEKIYHFRDYEFPVKRDTLTTSVIVWDPNDPANNEIDFVATSPHNSDDGNHSVPPGFPGQVRPPKGWRSEDIPLNQVGAYFVSLLSIRE
jgi:hypothetical protein